MNKKFTLLAGAALLSIAFAPGAQAASDYGSNRKNDTTPDTGFYLGTYGGYGWTDAEVDGGPDLDVNGWDYGLFAGYQLGQFLDNSMGITGAIEGFYGWSEADDDVGPINIEKDNEWGINFRPGLSFFNVESMGIKPYAIVGYRRAEFEASGGGLSGDEDYDGLELGLGTELVAYGDFGVRLDYSHVFYGEENGVDPSENDLRLGIAYHF